MGDLTPQLLIAAAALVVVLVGAAVIFTLWAVRWGATTAECSTSMPDDENLAPDSRAYVAMTRAITIDASTETVWP